MVILNFSNFIKGHKYQKPLTHLNQQEQKTIDVFTTKLEQEGSLSVFVSGSPSPGFLLQCHTPIYILLRHYSAFVPTITIDVLEIVLMTLSPSLLRILLITTTTKQPQSLLRLSGDSSSQIYDNACIYSIHVRWHLKYNSTVIMGQIRAQSSWITLNFVALESLRLFYQ